MAEFEARLSRFEKGQRDLVAKEMKTILGNLAKPGLDGHALTEEIRNLRQIQERGWNASLFEGLMRNSTHLAGLKQHPENYGRILDDRDPVDPSRGIHILLDAEKMRILELTPFAFAQLLANQPHGVPEARMQLTDGIWAYPEGDRKILAPPPLVGTASTFTNSIGMEFVRIEPGEFTMGSDCMDIEKPPHTVRITRVFYLGDQRQLEFPPSDN